MSKQRMLILFSVSMALAVSGCGAATTDANDEPSAIETEGVLADGELLIGSQLTTPPLTYRNIDDDTVTGLNYDLAQEMGERLGVKVEFLEMGFPGLIPAVQSGKVDLAMDIINDTKERQKEVDFIDYLQNGTTMLVKAGNPENIGVLDDLCGHSAALIRGSVQIALVEEQSKECQEAGKAAVDIKQYESPPQARLQVQTGRVAAFFGNTPVMIYLAENAEEGKAFEAATTEQYQPQPVGMILSKENPELQDAVLGVLEEIWADGTYDEIMEKYELSDLKLEAPTLNGAEE